MAGRKWQRWLLGVMGVVGPVVALCLLYPWTHFFEAQELFSKSFNLDLGGVLTLFLVTEIAVLIVIWRYDSFEAIWRILKGAQPYEVVTVFALTGVGFFALWVTVRAAFRYARNYLLIQHYPYLPENIFNILGYALTTNLCFTLVDTFLGTAAKRKTRSPAEDQMDRDDSKDVARGLIDVSIQAVLIAFLTILPRFGDSNFLKTIGGAPNFALVIMSMIAGVAILLLCRKTFTQGRSIEQTRPEER